MSVFMNHSVTTSVESDTENFFGSLDVFVKKEEPERDPLDLLMGPGHDGASGVHPDLTPMFDSDPSMAAVEDGAGKWGSLFDDEIHINPADVFSFSPQSEEDHKPAELPVQDRNVSFLPTPIFEEAPLNTGAKKRVGKVDHLGVVAYNRKNRAAPLSPVVAESDDPAALKRARNTEAARRSRARKMQRMGQLELKVEQLLARNAELEQEVSRLNSLLSK